MQDAISDITICKHADGTSVWQKKYIYSNTVGKWLTHPSDGTEVHGSIPHTHTHKLTENIQEGEGNQEVGTPVEAAGEWEGSSSYSSGKYLTEKEPGHCSKQKKNEELSKKEAASRLKSN